MSALIHYWPIFESNVDDIINGFNLYSPLNALFTQDRKEISNSALIFTEGYYRIPPGYYFNGDFSIVLWIKVYQPIAYVRIFDFFQGQAFEALSLMFIDNNGKLRVEVFYGNTLYAQDTTSEISLGFWNHICLVNKDKLFSLYINGTEGFANTPFELNFLDRSFNYIGKSNDQSDPCLTALFDDFKIFNKALTFQEIMDEFNF